MKIPLTCSRNNKEMNVDIKFILAFDPNYSDNVDDQGTWTIKCSECDGAHMRTAGAELDLVRVNYTTHFGKPLPEELTEEEIIDFASALDQSESSDIVLALSTRS